MATPADRGSGELLRRLAAAAVDFVVIGGVAVIFHGSARVTKDLDIMYATDSENLAALGLLLMDLDARLRGVADDVPFVPDERTLRRVMVLTLETDAGALDILAQPAGAPPYDEIRAAAQVEWIGDREIRIASIDHLMAMKRAAGRPQDIADLAELEAIKRRSAGGS